MPKSKFEPRYGVMENYEKRTDTKMVERLFYPELPTEVKTRLNFEDVSLDSITPRAINRYSQRGIERLAKSIEKTGGRLIHPVVLVKAKDLPGDSEVLLEYQKQGVNIKDLDLVIVAGERRFRAFKYLQGLENERLKGVLGAVNKYDHITANILTKEEALNEESFYEDSNMEARQISVLAYVMVALDEIKDASPEELKRIMDEMEAYDPEKYKKTQRFNKTKYCMYFLETVFTITDRSEAIIKKNVSLAENCAPEVTDAVLKCSIPARAVELIMNKPKEEQLAFLSEVEEGGNAVLQGKINEIIANKEADKLKKKRKKPTKYSAAKAYKCVDSIRKGLLPEKKYLEEVVGSLGGESRAELDKFLKEFDKFISRMDDIIARHS